MSLKARWVNWMRGLLCNWFGVADDFRKIWRATKLAAYLFSGLALRFLLILLLPVSALVLALFEIADEKIRAGKLDEFLNGRRRD